VIADIEHPPDEAARERIRCELDETLFVEAGAGSGKTSALVGRVVELVVRAGVSLDAIAAITFTEKAGAELRDRIRHELVTRLEGQPAHSAIAERCNDALDDLDGAAIGTLHSFAQRVLVECSVEARLPPRIEVLDEVSSEEAFERRWTAFREELLSNQAYERPLGLLLATNVKFEALRRLALTFEQNWDLVEERVLDREPAPPDVCELVQPVLDDLREVIRLGEHCLDENDRLLGRLEKIEALAGRCGEADEIDLLELVCSVGKDKSPWGSFTSNVGQKGNWPGGTKDQVLDGLGRVETALVEVAEQVSHAAVRQLGSALKAFTLRAAHQRRDAGQLAFHDLLVMARALVRDPRNGADVRTRLHRRYQRILLDEFQDTDPIQIELAVRIAAADPGSEQAGSRPWFDVAVEPGRLFVVGDPKQSIYRFRRADISLFIQARARFGADGSQVDLVTNFRSSDEVIGWVNETFDALMDGGAEAAPGIASQPAYVELAAVRPAASSGPAVSVVGLEPHEDGRAGALREAEARDVAGAIQTVLSDRWLVGDGQGGWREAKLGDITILLPSRASLTYLEDALAAAHIPYRAESSSLVYSTRAVRDLLMVLRAVDDQTDHLRIASALRSPLFGCGDDDLARFKVERRGHWGYARPQPDTVPLDDPVRIGLEYLRELAEQRYWTTPSELLERIAEERRAFEIGFAEGRPRDVWRRLRYVIDQARRWSEVTGGSLRQYLQWVDRQTADGARVAEAVLPETDDDAVRIMTIHAAKGLEFPIAIVSGVSTQVRAVPSPAEVAFPPSGDVGYRLGKHVVTDVYSEWLPIDEQMGYHERIRLLYVACTRARDHLVVSLHRLAKPTADPQKRTAAELIVAGMGDRLDKVVQCPVVDTLRLGAAVRRPEAPPPFAEWEAERTAVLARASRPSTIAATALTDDGGLDADDDLSDGLEKRPRDMDLPPWLKGRYGTAVGRAVHGVLQTIDLATGDGAAEAIAAQCQAEAIPDRVSDVTKLVGDALGSATVRTAAGGPHWREVYACTPTVGGRLLEGYVDLLYRSDEGLVVVDYKTAATNDPDLLEERVRGYRLQGASYAISIEQATAEPVARVVFLFLTPKGAVEIELAELDRVRAEVEELVAAGGEVVMA
jgi:ATP-dependent exoDNAse (exonuclease V) beta subunit